MYFGKYTSYCTSSNNNTNSKLSYLETIIANVQPDIFTVNEMDDQSYDADLILNNSLNTNGVSRYKRALMKGDYLVNMLYYNSEKLELVEQYTINTEPRITDVYRLRYIGGSTSEQAELYCFVCHLKAGSGGEDASRRKNAARLLMNYIDSNIEGNYLVMGDMNLYGSSEGAFQEFINPSNNEIKLNDPVEQIGEWNNEYNYRNFHTQSTHTSGSGCHSGGGFDDRFDFILSSNSIIDGSNQIAYVQNSYKTFGQDGNRFNSTLLSPDNTSLSSEVISALYHNSDHLPVILDLEINGTTMIDEFENGFDFHFNNPARDILNIEIKGIEPGEDVEMSIFSLSGKIMFSRKIMSADLGEELEIDLSYLRNGLYILNVNGIKGSVSKKLIIQ